MRSILVGLTLLPLAACPGELLDPPGSSPLTEDAGTALPGDSGISPPVDGGTPFAPDAGAPPGDAGCPPAPACSPRGASEYKDVGAAADFDTGQNIYFDRGVGFHAGWPKYWAFDSYAGNQGAFHEDSNQLWWLTLPGNPTSKTSYRVIQFKQHGRFRVRADRFSTAGTLYLSMRYKDDILPGTDPAGAPVYSWNGSAWAQLGALAGLRDHRWKTAQLTVSQQQRSAVNGYFVFKIGVDQYTGSIIGELGIDKVKLGTTPNLDEFEVDTPGLWPQRAPSPMSNLVNSCEYIAGQGPMFVYGMYFQYFISDGGSATRAGFGPKDSWKILEDARMNTYVIMGWKQPWYSNWSVWAQDYAWDDPASAVNPGLKEHLVQARAHNLKVIPLFLTDTMAEFIKGSYGGEKQALDALSTVVSTYADDPNLLMFNMVDEWDHESWDWGKPHLFSAQLFDTVRRAAPKRARYSGAMGFKGAPTWKLMTNDGVDVVGNDTYLSDYGGVESGLAKQAERLDEMRRTVGKTNLYFLIGQTEPHANITGAQVMAQGYQAITHGAKGVLYFPMNHPSDPRTEPTQWAGLRQLGYELFGPDGIAPLLLPPATTRDVMGENNVVKSSSSAIHFIAQEINRTEYLIAVNSKLQAVSNTFTVQGLASGKSIATRFESGRTITSQSGSFTDSFGPLERHVYRLPP